MNKAELIKAIAEEIAKAMVENIGNREITNGDMVRAVFPHEEMYEQLESCTYYGEMRFNTSWWDSPYKGVSE